MYVVLLALESCDASPLYNDIPHKTIRKSLGMVAQTFNLSSWEAEAGRPL